MDSHKIAITLRPAHSADGIQMLSDDVYFTFGDGRLKYDCHSCGAQCCRGQGYYLQHGTELETHTKARPAIRFFLEPVGGAPGSGYQVRNCPPSCFFLDGDNLCSLHVSHGVTAKPETCRLFPFNNVFRLGKFLIVMPHLQLCPLEVTPAGITSTHSRYESLLGAMAAQGISAEVPIVATIGLGSVEAIALEREIVGLSERYLESGDYVSFAGAQLAVTDRAFGQSQRTSAESQAYAARFARLVRDVLGPVASADGARDLNVRRTLMAATPTVRAQLMFVPQKQPMEYSCGAARLPLLLIALDALVQLAHDAGMQRITYQTALRVFMEYKPLLLLLAHLDCEMVWRADAVMDLSFSSENDSIRRDIRISRALLPAEQRRHRELLANVLQRHLCDDPFERIVFLKRLAHRLVGRIVPRQEPVSVRRSWQRGKAAYQRRVLEHVNDELLMTVVHRKQLRTAALAHGA